MTAIQTDLIFTICACAFELICCGGAMWLLGIPQTLYAVLGQMLTQQAATLRRFALTGVR